MKWSQLKDIIKTTAGETRTEDTPVPALPTTLEEVKVALKTRRTNKAQDVDEISSEILKAKNMVIATKLHEFMNTIRSDEAVPEG